MAYEHDKAKGRVIKDGEDKGYQKPWKLGYDDLDITYAVYKYTGGATSDLWDDKQYASYVSVSNLRNCFNEDISKYGTVYVKGINLSIGMNVLEYYGSINFYLNTPNKISEVRLFVDSDSPEYTNGPNLSFGYDDGTVDIKAADTVQSPIYFMNSDGSIIEGKEFIYNVDTSKTLMLFLITGISQDSLEWGANIRNIDVFTFEGNPATSDNQNIANTYLSDIKSINQVIRNEVSLPNEDLYVSTSVNASTDYAVQVDASRGDKIVLAIYSDVAPANVVIEGSNDGVKYHEMDGISVDLSTWSTSKYNIYGFDPYTRYIRVTVTTDSTPPSELNMSLRSVRT